MKYIQTVLLLIAGSLVLSACYAPASRTEDELFFIEPEILDAVRPHLQSWSMLPPEATETEREEIGAELGVSVLAYDIYDYPNKIEGAKATIMIPLEHWHDWQRGMLYIPVEEELDSWGGYQIRPVEKYIYAYNISY